MEWGNQAVGQFHWPIASLPHCPINRNEQGEVLVNCSFTLWWV